MRKACHDVSSLWRHCVPSRWRHIQTKSPFPHLRLVTLRLFRRPFTPPTKTKFWGFCCQSFNVDSAKWRWCDAIRRRWVPNPRHDVTLEATDEMCDGWPSLCSDVIERPCGDLPVGRWRPPPTPPVAPLLRLPCSKALWREAVEQQLSRLCWLQLSRPWRTVISPNIDYFRLFGER